MIAPVGDHRVDMAGLTRERRGTGAIGIEWPAPQGSCLRVMDVGGVQMRHVRTLALLAAVVILAPIQGIAAGGGDPNKPRIICVQDQRGETCFVRTLEVSSTGLTTEAGTALISALGLTGRLPESEPSVDEHGVFRFMDRDLFQAVPSLFTVPQTGLALPEDLPEDLHLLSDPGEPLPALDILNLPALALALLNGENVVLGDAEATSFVLGALGQAQLAPPHGTPKVSNTTMEFSLNSDSLLPGLPGLGEGATWALDTRVSFGFDLDGIPLRGPGANVSVTLNPAGVVTQAQYALRQTAEGVHRRIIHPSLGPSVCRDALGLSADAEVTADLVYYAPPLDVRAATLVPHFDCNAVGDGTDDTIPLSRFVPAIAGGPQAHIAAAADGGTVFAVANVQGGTAPYRLDWNSATSGQVGDGSDQISYDVAIDPSKVDASIETLDERLTLTVTDSNGLVTSTDATLQVSLVAPTPEPDEPAALSLPNLGGAQGGSHAISGNQVGTWDGTDSPACAPYTGGFRDWTNNSPSPRPAVRFNYSTTWAWETDFRSDTISGGQDHFYADDIDMAFYCGHGGPNGFSFENSTYGPSDKNLNYTEARWGDRDLEWFALLSCQVMASTNGAGLSTSQRWGPAFNGLHEMMGFHTNAYPSGNLGASIAFYTQGYSCCGFTWAPRKVHDSFVQAVLDGQPDDTVWATLLPVSYSYTWNRNDFFWGRGSTGADIPANQIYYFVRYSGTV